MGVNEEKFKSEIWRLKKDMLMSRNQNLNTPLMLAISQGNVEIFILILYSFSEYFTKGFGI